MNIGTFYPGPTLLGKVRLELECAIVLPFVILPIETHISEIIHQFPCSFVRLDEPYMTKDVTSDGQSIHLIMLGTQEIVIP